MPVKLFCDRCHKETPTNYVSDRAMLSLGDWTAEVTIAHNGTFNDGILCEECLRKLLRDGLLMSRSEFAKHRSTL